jgi:hypothetical protein
MFTIEPPPASRISGTAAFTHSQVPVTLTRSTRVPLELVNIVERAARQAFDDCGVVDECIEPAEYRARGGGEGARLLGVAHVGRGRVDV